MHGSIGFCTFVNVTMVDEKLHISVNFGSREMKGKGLNEASLLSFKTDNIENRIHSVPPHQMQAAQRVTQSWYFLLHARMLNVRSKKHSILHPT